MQQPSAGPSRIAEDPIDLLPESLSDAYDEGPCITSSTSILSIRRNIHRALETSDVLLELNGDYKRAGRTLVRAHDAAFACGWQWGIREAYNVASRVLAAKLADEAIQSLDAKEKRSPKSESLRTVRIGQDVQLNETSAAPPPPSPTDQYARTQGCLMKEAKSEDFDSISGYKVESRLAGPADMGRGEHETWELPSAFLLRQIPMHGAVPASPGDTRNTIANAVLERVLHAAASMSNFEAAFRCNRHRYQNGANSREKKKIVHEIFLIYAEILMPAMQMILEVGREHWNVGELLIIDATCRLLIPLCQTTYWLARRLDCQQRGHLIQILILIMSRRDIWPVSIHHVCYSLLQKLDFLQMADHAQRDAFQYQDQMHIPEVQPDQMDIYPHERRHPIQAPTFLPPHHRSFIVNPRANPLELAEVQKNHDGVSQPDRKDDCRSTPPPVNQEGLEEQFRSSCVLEAKTGITFGRRFHACKGDQLVVSGKPVMDRLRKAMGEGQGKTERVRSFREDISDTKALQGIASMQGNTSASTADARNWQKKESFGQVTTWRKTRRGCRGGQKQRKRKSKNLVPGRKASIYF